MSKIHWSELFDLEKHKDKHPFPKWYGYLVSTAGIFLAWYIVRQIMG